MKKLLRLSVFALAAMFVFSSCNKDDDDNGNGNGNGGGNNSSGELTYDGQKFDLKSGLIEDYRSDGFHYNWDFSMVNTKFVQVTDSFDTYYEPDTIGIRSFTYFELFSAGTNEFRAGTFNYDTTFSIPTDKNYFNYAELFLDLNENGTIDFGTEYFSVTGGSVTVTKNSESNYKLEFDVKLNNGKSASGNYSGPFFMD